MSKSKAKLYLFEKSHNGWLSPMGKLTRCRECEHRLTAEDIEGPDVFTAERSLEKKGWAKLSKGRWFWDYSNPRLPNPTQKKFMVNWCIANGIAVSILLQD